MRRQGEEPKDETNGTKQECLRPLRPGSGAPLGQVPPFSRRRVTRSRRPPITRTRRVTPAHLPRMSGAPPAPAASPVEPAERPSSVPETKVSDGLSRPPGPRPRKSEQRERAGRDGWTLGESGGVT